MNEIKVYYDGHCPVCVRSMNLVRTADKIGLVNFTSFRDLNKADLPVREDILERSIVVETRDGRKFTGMHAVLKILLRMPELFILAALVFFMNTVGIGEITYSKISSSRYSILSGSCSDNCRVNETGSKHL